MRFGPATLAAVLVATLLSQARAQPGALDPTFGAAGIALGSTSSFARDVVLDRDGRIVFVGSQSTSDLPDEALVGRLLPDGTPDPSFHGDGIQSISTTCRYPARTVLEAVDVTTDGAVVSAGTTGCRRGVVVRLLERGGPDPAFGNAGVFQYFPDSLSRSSAFFGMDVGDDGKVVAVGREVREELSGEIRTYLLVVRLTAQGRRDATFGTAGVVRLRVSDDLLPDSQLNDLVIYPDGRVLGVGYVLIGGAYQTVVTRLNVDGTPDATFEGGGLVVHDFGGGVADVSNALLYGPDG